MDRAFQQLGHRVPARMAAANVPGLSLAWWQGGQPPRLGHFGVRQAGTDAPVTDMSVFEAASLSKPAVAWAALRLVDQERLHLDTPLANYLGTAPDGGLDGLGRTITARQVLSHTSGLPNWRPAQTAQVATAFPPGSRFSYSGEGFVLLGRALVALTGEPLATLLQTRVLAPLGMAQSSFAVEPGASGELVFNHDAQGHPTRRAGWRQANAAASLATTAQDYARFTAAAAAGQGLRPETARLLWTPATPVGPGPHSTNRTGGPPHPQLAWALGFGLFQDGSDTWIWHWGDNGDTKSLVVASPRQQSGLVVLTNSRNGSLLFRDLMKSTLGLGPAPLDWLGYHTLAL